MKTAFLAYTPFTGLGLYGGFRGNRWLRNRITIFKQFVIPSLLNQTDRDFVHWISWRPEDQSNPYIMALGKWLDSIPNYKYIFTFGGVCFWDDKYPDEVARDRLAVSLMQTLPQLLDVTSDASQIIMLLQPSDDLYEQRTVASMKKVLSDKKNQAISFLRGYICNYITGQIKEYNPKTNPPFFAIRFPRATFFDPGKHIAYTGPYKSHEYVGEKLKVAFFEERGFMVGCHGENISTHFNHPYGQNGEINQYELLKSFGILNTKLLKLPPSVRKWFMRQLPHRWRRKIRYIFGEIIGMKIYNWLRA